MRTLRRGGAIIGVAVACTAFGAASAGAAVQTFAFTGDEQTFTVPAGVRAVHVVAIGAPGGANPPVAAGGTGDRVEADVAVPPGATQLFVEVGAKGFEGGPSRGFATDSGFNGGGQSCCGAGNGGGASDVRTLPRTDIRTLNSRLLIAGGGGGAGSGSTGRAGGPAGLPNGHHGGGSANETGGAGGFPTEGGQGGFGSDSTGNGQGGTLGQGGMAGLFFGNASAAVGGGGGGGLFGGGGGGASPTEGGGGGGGASSFVTATNGSFSADDGGVARVTISYVPKAKKHKRHHH